MTTVTATPTEVSGEPARGYLRFVPTTGWQEPEDIQNLPLPQVVKLVSGSASVVLDPTGPGWAWAVTFQIYGLPQWTHYYLVPDLPSIDISALPEVDIQTLMPVSSEPDPAWYAYVDSIVAGQVGRVTVVTGAEPRPGFGSVFWVGGTTQPANMAENTDIWFKATS